MDYNEAWGEIMQTINITEAKANLFEVINQVIAGEDIIIESMGKPVARLSRYEPTRDQTRIGLMAGQALIPDDFDECPLDWFEEPLQPLHKNWV